MQVSGNVSSQVSSAQSLKAYDQTNQVKRQDASKAQEALLLAQAAQQTQQTQQSNNSQSTNQPTPGATVGSVINTTA